MTPISRDVSKPEVRTVASVLVFAGLVGCASAPGSGQGEASTEDGRQMIPPVSSEDLPYLGDPDTPVVPAEEAPYDERERETILAELERRGLDASTATFFADGRVSVEGDLVVDGDAVLATSAEPVRKGYTVTSPLIDDVSEIYLVQDPQNPLSPDWTWAFVVAATDYNTWTPVNFNVWGNPPQGAYGTILRKAPLPLGDPCQLAMGSVPAANRPGLVVTVNEDYNCPPPNFWQWNDCHVSDIELLPFSAKRKIATHELGHTLGLTHPNAPRSEKLHVAGTDTANNLYPSVMWQGCAGSQPFITEGLSWDDIATLGALY